VNEPVSKIKVPPAGRSPILTMSAAGFITTSTSGASPAVSTAWAEKLIWNAETPNVVPAGARISAGKSGKVAKSLPWIAVAKVNWLPVSCMPSPESPAKRMTTDSKVSSILGSGVSACARLTAMVLVQISAAIPGRARGGLLIPINMGSHRSLAKPKTGRSPPYGDDFAIPCDRCATLRQKRRPDLPYPTG